VADEVDESRRCPFSGEDATKGKRFGLVGPSPGDAIFRVEMKFPSSVDLLFPRCHDVR
jgi:hypothetical protein